jgi:hypothetical protein
MKKVVWVLVGLVFIIFFMLWRYQAGEQSCFQCFSLIFPEESQDVETSLVSHVNQQACSIMEK